MSADFELKVKFGTAFGAVEVAIDDEDAITVVQDGGSMIYLAKRDALRLAMALTAVELAARTLCLPPAQPPTSEIAT